MHLAYITSAQSGETDRVLSEAAALLARRGVRLAGVVQTNIQRPQRYRCDMDLRLLPNGPVINITQDLGANARGCQLNPGALEQAVAEVARRLARGDADMLILNKFGKHEAEGRGFRELVGEALERGLPVLLGVNGLNLPDFLAFTGGLAVPLPCDPAALADWAGQRALAPA